MFALNVRNALPNAANVFTSCDLGIIDHNVDLAELASKALAARLQ